MDTNERILRQVLLKIASEQVKGDTKTIYNYAKSLREQWDYWK